MIFEPGYYYYVLTADEYGTLQEAMEIYLAENPEAENFLNDFGQSSDGYYVAGAVDISEEEANFLAYLGIGEYTDYKQSTQSTNFY